MGQPSVDKLLSEYRSRRNFAKTTEPDHGAVGHVKYPSDQSGGPLDTVHRRDSHS